MSRSQTVVRGPALVRLTCARRLAPLGVRVVGDSDTSGMTLSWDDDLGGDDEADGCLGATVSWYGPAAIDDERPASEATIQALSGLMHLHGRDGGGPRRLGLEVASVTAGLLAAQGVLAARIGASRGHQVSGMATSVLEAGLLLASHYVAAATCAEPWAPARTGPAPGPPFASADGHWFEIETLDPESWKRFWTELGAADAELGRAWALFRARYYQGTCTLPVGLHEATATHALAKVMAVAADCRVSLSPLRSYADVLAADPPLTSHPEIEPLFSPPADRGVRTGAAVVPDDGELPLRGLRVVEATSRLQGPLAGLLLQMLGAQVTRVEPPGGDFGRIVPPVAGDTGSFFLCFNRGKTPAEVDLSTAAGRGDLVELASQADVFLHNWRPGKAAEWGLDAPDLHAVNPRLVYVGASGWGDQPLPLLGTDFLVQAYAGLGNGLHPHEEPPLPSRMILVDYLGALITGEGILGGLYERERRGYGCSVRTSLLAGAMGLQAHVLDDLVNDQEEGRRGGRPVWGPLDHPLETADHLIVLTIEDDASYRQLCEICGVDPSLSSCSDRSDRSDSDAALVRGIARRPAAEWQEELFRHGIACEVVPRELDPSHLPADPRLAGLFETLAEPCQAPRSPWRFVPQG